MQREELQSKFLQESLNDKNILFNFYTGFGKTKVCVDRIRMSGSRKQWLIIVPKIVLQKNFLDDYEKWGGDLSLIKDVICYNSLYKYEGVNYNVVCDEAHHCTEDVCKSLEKIGSDERIFLSATISEEIMSRIDSYFRLRRYRYTLQEGIKDGIAPEQDIRVVRVNLDDKQKIWEHKMGKNVYKYTALYKYRRMSELIEYWKFKYFADNSDFLKNRWMKAALDRKNFMAEYKVPICKQLMEKLDNEDRRGIVFVNSVNQAIELGGKNSVHSKQSSKINSNIIEKFNNFEVNTLFTKDILSEGINLSSLDYGLFLHIDHSEGRVGQKMGRVSTRAEFPVLYVIVINNTKDETNFNELFKDYKKYITEYE